MKEEMAAGLISNLLVKVLLSRDGNQIKYGSHTIHALF